MPAKEEEDEEEEEEEEKPLIELEDRTPFAKSQKIMQLLGFSDRLERGLPIGMHERLKAK